MSSRDSIPLRNGNQSRRSMGPHGNGSMRGQHMGPNGNGSMRGSTYEKPPLRYSPQEPYNPSYQPPRASQAPYDRPRVPKYDARNYRSKKHSSLSAIKNHFVAASGEFVGTTMFLWFAFAWHQTVATQTNGTADNGLPLAQTVLFIGLAYGFSLLVNAWAFYRISGGLFNPAVTVCLVLTGSLPIVRGIILIPAEILGGITVAALVSCMFPGDISVVVTTLSPNTSIVRGLFIEMFLTFLLLFVIHILAAEKSKATFVAPLAIGLSLFVAELAGVLYTGGSLNPARSFGPAVVALSFPGYHWIYWVGPLLGSLMTAGYYHLIKLLNYEEANPGQDSAAGDFDGAATRQQLNLEE